MLIQRLGRALNLNLHVHMLRIDGVHETIIDPPQRKPRLHCVHASIAAKLTQLEDAIARHVSRHLAKRG